MGFTVVYGSPTAAGGAALMAGQATFAERQQDKAREEAARQQQIAVQQQENQANRMHDVQRMMLGAQIEAGQQAQQYAMNRAGRAEDMKLNQAAEDAELGRRKQFADYSAGLERQALDSKMSAADKVEAKRIENNIRAIEASTTLRPEQKNQLLDAARIQDHALRSRVAQQVSQVPPRFVDLPPERQPGQPPWAATKAGPPGPDGQPTQVPLTREVYDDEGNPTGRQEPVLMITNADGVAEPWYDKVAEARRNNAAKAKGNQLRVEQEQNKNFATFAGTALKSLISEDGTLPEGVEDRIVSMWEKMQTGRGGPRGTQSGPSIPPEAQKLMQYNGQKEPVRVTSVQEVGQLSPGTVFVDPRGVVRVVPMRGFNSGGR